MISYICILGFPGGTGVKNLPTKAGDRGDMGLILGWGRFPWRRKWQPIPIFLPGESHGQGSLVGYSSQGHKELDTTEHACIYICVHLNKTGFAYRQKVGGCENYVYNVQEIYKGVIYTEFTCCMKVHEKHLLAFSVYRGDVGFYLRDTVNYRMNCSFYICTGC